MNSLPGPGTIDNDHEQGPASQDTLDGLDGRGRTLYEDKFVADATMPGLFYCILCGKGVRNRWHHFSTHYRGSHRCIHCSAVYARVDKLKAHLRGVHHVEITRYSRYGPYLDESVQNLTQFL